MSAFGRQGWYPVKPPGYDAVWSAVAATVETRPRPIAESAVALLRAHESHLAHFGGADGLVDSCDAAAHLTWALKALAALLLIARGGAS